MYRRLTCVGPSASAASGPLDFRTGSRTPDSVVEGLGNLGIASSKQESSEQEEEVRAKGVGEGANRELRADVLNVPATRVMEPL